MGFWSRITGGSTSHDGAHQGQRPLLEPVAFSSAIHKLHGLPHMDWQQVRNIISDRLEPELAGAAVACAVRYWLEMMAAAGGTRYAVFEDSDFLIMHSGGAGRARRITEAIAPAWHLIGNLMEISPKGDAGGLGLDKRAILIFDNPDQYYDYISVFYPDQNTVFGTSAGVFLSHGYPHIVLNAVANAVSLQTLVHELTHSAVANLPLPRWLNEGLAQQMEDLVRPAHLPFKLSARELRVQQRYWGWFGIQRFWFGSSFNLKGGQRPSYQLSEVIVRSLMTGRGRNGLFKQFLLHAHRRDAGEQAARQFLNVGVGDLAAEFLGSGPWSPLPTTESDE